ncbi:MAG TPA: hypothetical protein VFS43_18365 [Polyangiaceae bacterium]|nr:hypothetical protein [Polyangiaceae bacterium]
MAGALAWVRLALVEVDAHEGRVLVARQGAHVLQPRRPAGAARRGLDEVLLDVRGVQHAQRQAAPAHLVAHAGEAPLAREVGHERHHPVFALEPPHRRVPRLGAEEARRLAPVVARGEQLAEGRVAAGAALHRVAQLGALGREGLDHVPQRAQIGRAQLDAELLGALFDVARAGGDVLGAGALLADRPHDRLERRVVVDPGRRVARKQVAQEGEARRRALEGDLVEEVHQEVLAPDVRHERELGLQGREVGEVLFGPDAHVAAAAQRGRLERRHHVQERRLVRDQVLAREGPAPLRERRDELPEGHVGDRRRRGAGPLRPLGRARGRRGRGGRGRGPRRRRLGG